MSSVKAVMYILSNITTSFILHPICGHAVMSFGESQRHNGAFTILARAGKPAPDFPSDPAAHMEEVPPTAPMSSPRQ